ncbi:MAG: hypothetical protein A3E36_03415 [Candidatus Andersenbacteria bacterium RIFCSPHIGHO2_12_FULL_45_11b]|uniref:DUF3800 domain-containing protein n=1 Tax=Candidatus Andersenbacteria bacterium RIFCSPHIGHO2_12_FULL_45_11b TaxID=1797282 RepID=A0A1G1XB99_9BACT|nr:MAG: hypothetical protein A3E36_03415 [Candidatus Andersenbacteria bacterium RIFCSPHIGHO2_12_FULL_45_11b]
MATVFEYIDESGQDTLGYLFVVSVVIADERRDALLELIERIEIDSKKRNRKWHGSDPKYRAEYLESISRCAELEKKIFIKKFSNRNDYTVMTAQTAGEALLTQRADKAVIYVDGLRESQKSSFKRSLKPSLRISAKIRGVRKDENNAFIRLADAICGVVRDSEDGNRWAKKLVRRLIKRSILMEL